MGLGAYSVVSPAEARDRRDAARKLLAADIDPIDHREAARLAEVVKQAEATTFTEAAKAYIEAHSADWQSPKRAAQWPRTIAA